MIQVGVAYVKAHFSEFLARVRAGEEIVVTDHGRPVARLAPVSTDRQLASEEHLSELERAGIVRIGASRLPRSFWEAELPNDPDGAVLGVLLDERASGR